MELFENILTGEKSSKYKTNHFHMFVDDDVLIPDVENVTIYFSILPAKK